MLKFNIELLPTTVSHNQGRRTWTAGWMLQDKSTALRQVDRSHKGERFDQGPDCPCTCMDLFLRFFINTLLKSLGFPGIVCYCVGKPLPVQLHSSLFLVLTLTQFQVCWVRSKRGGTERARVRLHYWPLLFFVTCESFCNYWYSMYSCGSEPVVLHEQKHKYSLCTW